MIFNDFVVGFQKKNICLLLIECCGGTDSNLCFVLNFIKKEKFSIELNLCKGVYQRDLMLCLVIINEFSGWVCIIFIINVYWCLTNFFVFISIANNIKFHICFLKTQINFFFFNFFELNFKQQQKRLQKLFIEHWWFPC